MLVVIPLFGAKERNEVRSSVAVLCLGASALQLHPRIVGRNEHGGGVDIRLPQISHGANFEAQVVASARSAAGDGGSGFCRSEDIEPRLTKPRSRKSGLTQLRCESLHGQPASDCCR